MGATGSGKSTVRCLFLHQPWIVEKANYSPSVGNDSQFINLVSGSRLGVGGGLRSHTKTVQLAGAFDLDGRRVVLIDTPGFDDTTLSDTDVLKMIAAFLATS
jgi:GTP1/Obg family GTP-binding protein